MNSSTSPRGLSATTPDWTALARADGRSMVAFLAIHADIATNETGPIALNRDEFTAGLVTSAAELYSEVQPRIRLRRRRDS